MNIVFAIVFVALIIAGRWFRDIDYMPTNDRRLVIMARFLLAAVLVCYAVLTGRE